MRAAFVHEIEVVFRGASDERALGGVVTVELCGRWEHDPPCTWPHLTSIISRSDEHVVARVLFSCEVSDETTLRGRIVRAAQSGKLEGPDGRVAEWQVLRDRVATLTTEEVATANDW